ncbi:MAG: ATP-grasp domain-containing protein, partial [Deltaproteobacteria bacterium]|nr:ATP-grasp domain-containing protein [Deltaproteobacteria bacterium]
READERVRIGPAPAAQSYLNAEASLDAARRTGAEAIHPGYGFLSESAAFAERCAQQEVIFVGPPAQAMQRMKDKATARRLAAAAGVPVVPGSEVVPDERAALCEAERIGYPVIVKAAGGGGGIGMVAARAPEELSKAFRQCSDRARAAFGREAVYLERYFAAPRHVEVQILGDRHEHRVHLFERECSVQRRHQKVIEEAGSPLFENGRRPELAAQLYRAALDAARAFGYANAGTAEFLYNEGEIYFIEMNARLQVEHPVTELTTGVDIIGWQLRIAAGEPLTLQQHELSRAGHALEMRVYAEDPVRFLPSPGQLSTFRLPSGDGVRVDAGYVQGSRVTPHYDPLVAKLIVSGEDRAQAIARGREALQGFVIEGIKSNLALHARVLSSEAFQRGEIDTAFLSRLA